MITALITAVITTLTLSVANPLPEARTDVPVAVAIPPAAGQVRSAHIDGGTPWQLDDLDGDGRADELFMLIDLAPGETRTLTATLSPEPGTCSVAKRTHAYLKLHDKSQKHPAIVSITYPGDADNRQMYNSIYGHGAVLECEASAIRVYMDNRQSVDLYAKNIPRLELETTGFYTTRDQLDKGYGRDILWAGTSVAMGSFRAWDGTKPLTIDSVASRSQRVVADGPLRSIIEVTDRAWAASGQGPVDMTQRYTAVAGHRDYDVEILLDGAAPDAVYATGVQKIMNNNEGFVRPDGLAGSWGDNIPDKGMKEITDTLGLGIAVEPPYLAGTLEDADNYLTLLKADSQGRIRYSIASAAVRDSSSPRTAAQWTQWLEGWKRRHSSPVKVKVLSVRSKKK